MFRDDEKVGFIILHYNEFEITCKCVDSILNLENQEQIELVIVDNNSPNASGELLKNKYPKKNIHVLLLDENYGYSRANNIGWEYLQNNFKIKFAIVANNDIIFIQKNMLSLVEEIYSKEHFYVAGPDIFAIYKKEHQNPLVLKPRTEQEMLKAIKGYEKGLKNSWFENILHQIWLKVNKTLVYSLYRNILNRHNKEKQKSVLDYHKKQEDIVLQGACLIFSYDYLILNNKLFEPETYFYHEEDILAAKCLKNNWKTVYIPQLYVQHLEGASTNQKKYHEKIVFRYKNLMESGKIYLNYLKENE